MGDVTDARWMTYAELGRARGISTASATRLSFRRKWQRRAGNDGTARVAVPVDEARPHTDKTNHDERDIARLVSALEAAIAASSEREEANAATISVLREQLEQSNRQSQADTALVATLQDQLEQANGRAERAQVMTYVLRDGADELQGQLALAEQARDHAQEAQQTAERLRRADIAIAEQARAQAQAARDNAEAVRQADAARRSLGLLGRLLAAWRGA
jgi:chromosome segregation ATPase